MSDQLKLWYSVIQKHSIHADNSVRIDGIVVVINVLELPGTDTSVVTLSLVKDRNKKSALQPHNFMKFMFQVESCMSRMRKGYDGPTDPMHFVNTSKQLSSSWFIALKCHRVFFIPTKMSQSASYYFMRKDFIKFTNSISISKVVVRTNTSDSTFMTLSK